MIKSILGDFDFTTEPVAMNINNGPVDNQSPHMTACVATLVENIYWKKLLLKIKLNSPKTI